MKIGVAIFPGSNCDRDMIYALETKLGQEVCALWHKHADLQGVDLVVLPGGFSYGDYLRSGAIARFSPIMESVTRFAEEGGLVLGICNGFQVLCEAGLLPGALLPNPNHNFSCKNVFLRPAQTKRRLTAQLDSDGVYRIPVAHGEGRYYIDETGREELIKNHQILFQYCEEDGNISERANFNGSTDNIAGVCNSAGNVMGMMPHPERAADAELGNEDGALILQSLLATELSEA